MSFSQFPLSFRHFHFYSHQQLNTVYHFHGLYFRESGMGFRFCPYTTSRRLRRASNVTLQWGGGAKAGADSQHDAW